MGFLSWIVVGGLAGLIAGMFAGEKRGLIGNIIIGVLGANIGGFIASKFDVGKVDGINLSSILIAAGGALIVLSMQGFAERWHPSEKQERLCAAGRMQYDERGHYDERSI